MKTEMYDCSHFLQFEFEYIIKLYIFINLWKKIMVLKHVKLLHNNASLDEFSFEIFKSCMYIQQVYIYHLSILWQI